MFCGKQRGMYLCFPAYILSCITKSALRTSYAVLDFDETIVLVAVPLLPLMFKRRTTAHVIPMVAEIFAFHVIACSVFTSVHAICCKLRPLSDTVYLKCISVEVCNKSEDTSKHFSSFAKALNNWDS